MLAQRAIGAIVVAAAWAMPAAGAQAYDDGKYPDLNGRWTNAAPAKEGQWDPSKPPEKAQQPPLTQEYQAIWDATLARRASGWRDASCLPPGMPRAMIAAYPIEVIVKPQATHIMFSYMNEFRRIYTDGRKWPDDVDPSRAGYSIGKWQEPDRDGRFTVLTVETRDLKGPRMFDGSGIPMSKDDETVVNERIWLDKANPNLMHDEITTIDHALTRPWTVTRDYGRERNADWPEYLCAEQNHEVMIGGENYAISAEGLLTPTRKDQPAPDLKYFKQSRK